MVSPPQPTIRRAWIAAAWLLITFTGLIGAVWAIGGVLKGGAPPSLQAVATATHLAYPDSTRVVDADLAGTQTPTPGSRAEATVDIPAADFGAFINDNGMAAPLISGTLPSGAATGTIPAGCTLEVCYGTATIIIDGDTVTVELEVSLI